MSTVQIKKVGLNNYRLRNRETNTFVTVWQYPLNPGRFSVGRATRTGAIILESVKNFRSVDDALKFATKLAEGSV